MCRALAAKAQEMFMAPFSEREEIYFRIKHAFIEAKRELDVQVFDVDMKLAGGAKS